jgi:hypothetical protein
MQPCELYQNSKEAKQQLFAAAAALYLLTGDVKYRDDADKKWWGGSDLFNNNWNHVYTQGITIMAITPNPGRFTDLLKESVQKWVDCSNGVKTDLCECASSLLPVCLITCNDLCNALWPSDASSHKQRHLDFVCRI